MRLRRACALSSAAFRNIIGPFSFCGLNSRSVVGLILGAVSIEDVLKAPAYCQSAGSLATLLKDFSLHWHSLL